MVLVVMDNTLMRRGEDDSKRLAIGMSRDAGVDAEALVLSGHGGLYILPGVIVLIVLG